MGFWADLGNLACSCIFFAGNVIADTALTIREYIQKASGAVVTPNIQRQRIDISNGLHDLNRQLQELLRKRAHDGMLSKRDEAYEKELLEKRNRQKERLWETKEAECAEEVKKNPNDVKATIITPENPHILQYHVGQITKNKRCQCGREMVLNFKRDIDTINMNDFIWTCVSYYSKDPTERKCPALPYKHSDSTLFVNEKIDEIECANEDLTTIFQAEQKKILSRMDQHCKQTIDNYLCPIHGTDLVLRRKSKDVKGALDQYFLACSYFNFDNPKGPDSCRYKVKLKSPAQLAAALRRFEGKGIL